MGWREEKEGKRGGKGDINYIIEKRWIKKVRRREEGGRRGSEPSIHLREGERRQDYTKAPHEGDGMKGKIERRK
jgi:hypothetical protein